MDLKSIEAKLQDPAFFKKAIPSVLFIFSTWKRDYRTYQEADRRGVVPSVRLRTEKCEGSYYAVNAYALDGEIPPEALASLQQIVNEASVGTIRFDAQGTNGFFPLLDGMGQADGDYELLSLCRKFEGVFIQVLTGESPEDIDCPVVVYAIKGRSMQHWALAAKHLS